MADGKSKSDILSAVVVDDLAAPGDEPTLCGDAHVTVWRRGTLPENAPTDEINAAKTTATRQSFMLMNANRDVHEFLPQPGH
jgi:hypothetical protein